LCYVINHLLFFLFFSDKKVAIKRIKPYCGDEWEARHTLREVRLMRLLGVHPNIISLTNLWTNDKNDSELYIVMELMDSDLHQIIQSKQLLRLETKC
jgi:serine/threonine protein kinase